MRPTVPVVAEFATTLNNPVPVYAPVFVIPKLTPVVAEESKSSNPSGEISPIPMSPPFSNVITSFVPSLKIKSEVPPERYNSQLFTPLFIKPIPLELAVAALIFIKTSEVPLESLTRI